MFIHILTATFVANAAIATKRIAPKTIAEIKHALASEKAPEPRFYLASELVQSYASQPLTHEMVADAKASAEALLETSARFKSNWDYGNAIHHSHLVLGRLHLRNGKVADAKRELKLAGQTPGSPQLNSFGPNMTLAKELLEKGEKSAVLEYFDACAVFWKSQFAKPALDAWKADVAKGRIPRFGGNLEY